MNHNFVKVCSQAGAVRLHRTLSLVKSWRIWLETISQRFVQRVKPVAVSSTYRNIKTIDTVDFERHLRSSQFF